MHLLLCCRFECIKHLVFLRFQHAPACTRGQLCTLSVSRLLHHRRMVHPAGCRRRVFVLASYVCHPSRVSQRRPKLHCDGGHVAPLHYFPASVYTLNRARCRHVSFSYPHRAGSCCWFDRTCCGAGSAAGHHFGAAAGYKDTRLLSTSQREHAVSVPQREHAITVTDADTDADTDAVTDAAADC